MHPKIQEKCDILPGTREQDKEQGDHRSFAFVEDPLRSTGELVGGSTIACRDSRSSLSRQHVQLL